MRFLVAFHFVFSLMNGYVASSGEYCHGWEDSYNTWHPGFQCPERYDGQDARYCCGTCTLRYCCTAAEARLDQSSCDLENVLEFENNANTNNIASKVPVYLPFVIVVGTFLSFLLIGTFVSICCLRCLKPKEQDCLNGSTPFQTTLLESGGPSPESVTPSRQSSSSSSSTGRSTMVTIQPNICTVGTEVSMNMYGPLRNGYPVTSSQSNQYVTHPQLPGTFYQPYQKYGIPPEHTMLMTPTFVDNRSMYGQQLVPTIPQLQMHTEQLFSGVTI